MIDMHTWSFWANKMKLCRAKLQVSWRCDWVQNNPLKRFNSVVNLCCFRILSPPCGHLWVLQRNSSDLIVNNVPKTTRFYCNLYSTFLPQPGEPNSFLPPVQQRIIIPFSRTGAHLVLMPLLFPPPSSKSAYGFPILQLWESKGSERVLGRPRSNV